MSSLFCIKNTASQLIDVKQYNVKAKLNYLSNSIASSLYRNRKVFTHRDSDGNDGVYQGVEWDKHEVIINDARNLLPSQNKHLNRHGFQLVKHPLAITTQQFLDNNEVVKKYYPTCSEIIMNATNATRVIPFDYNIRWPKGKKDKQRIVNGQQVQAPLHYVHGDYTIVSAPQRLRDLAIRPGALNSNNTLEDEFCSLYDTELISAVLSEKKRFSFINVWRNIDDSPVMKDPLALCDAQSKDANDLVVFEIYYDDRIGENYFSKYSPKHNWWYYPHMTHDEVLLIKQWDSAGRFAQYGGTLTDTDDRNSLCTFSFHSAFTDPNTPPEAPDRKSIEVRCVAFFD